MKIKSIFLSLLFSMLCLTSVQKTQALTFSTVAKELGLYSLSKQIVISSFLGNLVNYFRILKQGYSPQSSLSAFKTTGLYSGYGMGVGAAYNLYSAYQYKDCACKKAKCDCESDRAKKMAQNVGSGLVLMTGSAYLIAKLYGN